MVREGKRAEKVFRKVIRGLRRASNLTKNEFS